MRKQKTDLPAVRAFGQFGPIPKHPDKIKLFLDDARNPPLKEKGWVVVRTVNDGIWFMHHYGKLVTTVSLDNDLGKDPQGFELLQWILDAYKWKPICFPQLRTVIVHTGNMPKWRKMMRMLRGSGLEAIRRVPHDRIYPRACEDTRHVTSYKG